MDKDGKFDKEDLVRIAQAAFGPCIEVDRDKSEGYYIDLLEPSGPVRVRTVCRLLSGKSADVLANKILDVAGVQPEKDESMGSVVRRVRAERPSITHAVQVKLFDKPTP